MMEYWKNGVLKNRCTGVLARTCAGEDACTPVGHTGFPHHSNIPTCTVALAKEDIPTFPPVRRLVHRFIHL